VVVGVCVSVLLYVRPAAIARCNAEPRLHALRCPRRVALVSAAKVMRCIQCSLVINCASVKNVKPAFYTRGKEIENVEERPHLGNLLHANGNDQKEITNKKNSLWSD